MIDGLVRHALRSWPGWFDSPHPGTLRSAIVARGGEGWAQRGRGFVFLFPAGARRPQVVMKIAFAEWDAARVRNEFSALREVRGMVPGPLRETIPEALELSELQGATVLAIRGVGGRRPYTPSLAGRGGMTSRRLVSRLWTRTFAWSRDLARYAQAQGAADEEALVELTERFRTRLVGNDPAADRVRDFGRAIGRSRIRWTPTWQHRDVLANVHMERGRLHVFDWEYAAPTEPWFDMGHTPTATARLAKRQSRGRLGSLRAASLLVLTRESWAGRLLHRELGRCWNHAVPLSWAVALNGMWWALNLPEGEERRDRAAFTVSLLGDEEVRRRLDWLAPEW